MRSESPVLFFDGVCNLCNRSVQFVIRHDKKGLVKFAALQSVAGLEALAAVSRQHNKVPDSLILFYKGAYYTESTAALKLAGFLDGGWKLLRVLLITPAFLRNAVYRLIARNRYRWFGRQASCMLPAPELRSRFPEDTF